MAKKLIGQEEQERDGESPGRDKDKERSIRLKGKSGIKDQKVRSSLHRHVQRLLQDGRRPARQMKRAAGTGLRTPRPARIYSQRVAVRLTYARNKGDGTWRAHGNYLERESATGRNTTGRGFGSDGDDMPIAKTLEAWQQERDPNLFKLIISPEHGASLDLREFTTAYIADLEKQLGTKLQWVGADHYNTDNPHVHVAVRGRDDRGNPLIIPREFIRGPLREIAQQLATARLGHRTHQDIQDARQQQVKQHRWTDLDRMLKKLGQGSAIDFGSTLKARLSEERQELRLQLLGRLATLESMGLATRGQGGKWTLDPAAETILRERQKANDRLKVLHAHRALVSDPRLPLAAMPAGEGRVAGRLIGTGLDDASQKPYMLLETTRGSVIYLYQTDGAQKARGEGALQPGDFVVVNQRERTDADGRVSTVHSIRGFGPADQALSDVRILRGEIRQQLTATGSLPQAGTWGGWLGKFQGELAKEADRLQQRGIIHRNGERFEMSPPSTNNRPLGRGR